MSMSCSPQAQASRVLSADPAYTDSALGRRARQTRGGKDGGSGAGSVAPARSQAGHRPAAATAVGRGQPIQAQRAGRGQARTTWAGADGDGEVQAGAQRTAAVVVAAAVEGRRSGEAAAGGGRWWSVAAEGQQRSGRGVSCGPYCRQGGHAVRERSRRSRGSAWESSNGTGTPQAQALVALAVARSRGARWLGAGLRSPVSGRVRSGRRAAWHVPGRGGQLRRAGTRETVNCRLWRVQQGSCRKRHDITQREVTGRAVRCGSRLASRGVRMGADTKPASTD